MLGLMSVRGVAQRLRICVRSKRRRVPWCLLRSSSRIYRRGWLLLNGYVAKDSVALAFAGTKRLRSSIVISLSWFSVISSATSRHRCRRPYGSLLTIALRVSGFSTLFRYLLQKSREPSQGVTVFCLYRRTLCEFLNECIRYSIALTVPLPQQIPCFEVADVFSHCKTASHQLFYFATFILDEII